MTEGWLLHISLHNWTNVKKKCVNLHCEEKTLWSWPIWQNCWQETTVEEAKQCQKVPVGQGAQRLDQWNKVLWTDESKFKIFGSNRRVCVQQKVNESATTPCITSTVKHREGTVMVLEDFANCKIKDLHKMKGKLNQTNYHSILHHHVIPWLVGQGFVLMQDNDPKHTCKLYQRYIKSKEEQHILQLMSWPVQYTDLNPIDLMWDGLDQKVRDKQPTSAAHLW